MIYLPRDMWPPGYDGEKYRGHWEVTKTTEWRQEQCQDQVSKVINYNNRTYLNEHGRDHKGAMCVGPIPKIGLDLKPEPLHTKKCVVSRLHGLV